MTNTVTSHTTRLAFDVSGLTALKRQIGGQSNENIKQVANEFESIFIQMLTKSMRQTVPESGLFNSSSLSLVTSLFDQQIAHEAAGKGFGLASLLIKQLGAKSHDSQHNNENAPSMIPSETIRTNLTVNNKHTNQQLATSLFSDQHYRSAKQALGQFIYAKSESVSSVVLTNSALAESRYESIPVTTPMINFVKLWHDPAQKVALKSGMPYEVVIAQAALETGWGKKIIKTEEGTESYNYFGVKAGTSWQGKTAAIVTTEYVNQRPLKITENFRVYTSHHEALEDYIDLLIKDNRYSSALQAPTAEQAATALQQANYATDPNYATKLIQLIQRIKQIASMLSA